MPVGQALTAMMLRPDADPVLLGAVLLGAAAVAPAAGAPVVAAAGAGETTSCTSPTTSSGVLAARSDATNSGGTSARASAVSRVRWSASPCSGAAIKKARSAGPSGAPKSTFGDSRAKASDASVTAAERQCGIAMPPGRPVAAFASRAIASPCSASAPFARPATATSSASRWTTVPLSDPRSASSATNSGVISADMVSPACLSDVGAGGRDGRGGSRVAGQPGRDGDPGPVDLRGCRHGRPGKRGAGRAVGDRRPQSFGGLAAGEVGQHVPGQTAVA